MTPAPPGDPSRDQLVDAGALRAFCADVLAGLGARADIATTVAETLVDADLSGVESHGIHLLELYVNRIGGGLIDPQADSHVVDDQGSTVVIDGGLGFGQPVGIEAMDLAVGRARAHGIASVIVRETTHLGALGYYTRRAAAAGGLAMAFQNGPTAVPPFGGTTPMFSTNPFSYAVPTAEEPPVVFDIATTAVAGNKLLLAKKRGDASVPAGWANDEQGRPTTDTEAASVRQLQWFGGYKGFGIAFLVEVMAGVASGSCFGRTEASASSAVGIDRVAKGFQFIALDVERFMPLAEFRARVDALIRDVHSTELATGVERVYVPGEIEHLNRLRRAAEGIPVSGAVLDTLDGIAATVGVAPLADRLPAHS